MKNIHVFPTESFNPIGQQIWRRTNGGLFKPTKSNPIANFLEGKINIYITSDEEIKEGDWFAVELFKITGESSGLHIEKCIKLNNIWCNDFDVIYKRHKSNCNKIILTTDQDLINDGVQAIDDEFLEWFVKNPSCEVIEVEREKSIGYAGDRQRTFYGGYKIIIPKEEPKQESCEYIKEVGCIKDICTCNTGPKQETLKEAAENNYPEGDVWNVEQAVIRRLAFMKGAKWQSDRMYSEEELKVWLVHRDVYLYNYYTTYIKSLIPLESVEDFIKEHHEYLMDRKKSKKK